MIAEAITFALLSAAAPVVAIVGGRIYPTVVPQGQPTPAVVYEVVSAVYQGAIDAYAPTHLTRSRVQVSLVGPDFDQLRTLRDAVVLAMRFARGAIGGTTVHSVLPGPEGLVTFDEALDLWYRPIDFLLTHEAP